MVDPSFPGTTSRTCVCDNAAHHLDAWALHADMVGSVHTNMHVAGGRADTCSHSPTAQPTFYHLGTGAHASPMLMTL